MIGLSFRTGPLLDKVTSSRGVSETTFLFLLLDDPSLSSATGLFSSDEAEEALEADDSSESDMLRRRMF